MKRALIISTLILLSFIGKGQVQPFVQYGTPGTLGATGNTNSTTIGNGLYQSGIGLLTGLYNDTAAVNAAPQNLKRIPNVIIGTRNDNKLWYRDTINSVWRQFATGVSSTGWLLTGNAGTTAGTNFLGTTDNQDLIFKRNNVISGELNNALGNTSFGVNAFNLTATGFLNTINGWNSGKSITNGDRNSLFGEIAGQGVTSGSQNTGFGYDALGIIGSNNDNTALGGEAGLTLADGNGNGNLFLGQYANPVSGSPVNYSIALGYHAQSLTHQFAVSDSITALKMVGMSQGVNGYVLTDDGTGNLSLRPSGTGGSPTYQATLINGSDLLQDNTRNYHFFNDTEDSLGNKDFYINGVYTIGDLARNSFATFSNVGISYRGVNGTSYFPLYDIHNDGTNLFYNNNGTASDTTEVLNSDGTIRFNHYKNNSAGDSVLAVDADGNVTQKIIPPIDTTGFWSIYGNSNINQATNFIGTTNLENLVFKTNNTVGMTLSSAQVLSTTKDANIHGVNVGQGAGNLLTNSALGRSALLNNTSGNGNTAVGSLVLRANTTGIYNTASGTNALTDNVSGNKNTVVGEEAMAQSVDGSGNISIGYQSIFSSVHGNGNVAIGDSSLRSNTGDNNIAIGNHSGYYTTNNNEIFINSFDRSNYIGDTTLSIFYGLQDVTTANQRIRLNANVVLSNLGGNGTGVVGVDNNGNTFFTTGGSGSTPGIDAVITANDTIYTPKNIFLSDGYLYSLGIYSNAYSDGLFGVSPNGNFGFGDLGGDVNNDFISGDDSLGIIVISSKNSTTIQGGSTAIIAGTTELDVNANADASLTTTTGFDADINSGAALDLNGTTDVTITANSSGGTSGFLTLQGAAGKTFSMDGSGNTTSIVNTFTSSSAHGQNLNDSDGSVIKFGSGNSSVMQLTSAGFLYLSSNTGQQLQDADGSNIQFGDGNPMLINSVMGIQVTTAGNTSLINSDPSSQTFLARTASGSTQDVIVGGKTGFGDFFFVHDSGNVEANSYKQPLIINSPVYADGSGKFVAGNSIPNVLSTTTGIDARATGNTILYTNTTGQNIIITGETVRCTTATSVVTGPTTNTFTSTPNDIYTSTAIAGLTSTTQAYIAPTGGLIAVVPNGATVTFSVDVAASAASQILSVDIIGYSSN